MLAHMHRQIPVHKLITTAVSILDRRGKGYIVGRLSSVVNLLEFSRVPSPQSASWSVQSGLRLPSLALGSILQLTRDQALTHRRIGVGIWHVLDA
jgi:hypothetical protein